MLTCRDFQTKGSRFFTLIFLFKSTLKKEHFFFISFVYIYFEGGVERRGGFVERHTASCGGFIESDLVNMVLASCRS